MTVPVSHPAAENTNGSVAALAGFKYIPGPDVTSVAFYP